MMSTVWDRNKERSVTEVLAVGAQFAIVRVEGGDLPYTVEGQPKVARQVFLCTEDDDNWFVVTSFDEHWLDDLSNITQKALMIRNVRKSVNGN